MTSAHAFVNQKSSRILSKLLHFRASTQLNPKILPRQILPLDAAIVTPPGKFCLAIRQKIPICGIYALRAHLILPDKLISARFGT